jgi:hypothetical protein
MDQLMHENIDNGIINYGVFNLEKPNIPNQQEENYFDGF